MKKLSFLALAVAGLLLGACSDKDVVDESRNAENVADGGFFKVGLSLPSVPSTRADWNEDGTNTQLNSGKASEWTVDNVLLLIFAGTSESNATLQQVKSLTNSWTNVTVNNPDQVTTNHTEVVQLKSGLSGNLYALAVINGTGVIEQASESSIYLNGSTSATSGCKLSDLQAAISYAEPLEYDDDNNASTPDVPNPNAGKNKFVDASGNIFMTNAVLSDEQGGRVLPVTAAGNQHILVRIEPSFIYPTEEEASANTAQIAADIYVERGVAKVTLEAGTDYLKQTSLTAKDGTTLAAASFTGWCLDNTNMSSYVVRQVPSQNWNLVNVAVASSSTNDKYRFIGQTPVDVEYNGTAAGFRTYWAKDPNYDVAYSATNFYSPATKAWVATTGDENPIYCYENTFNVEHQTSENTTRALVKITLNGGADFYTVGADRKTLYSLTEVQKLVVSYLFAQNDFDTWYTTNGNGTLKGGSDVTIEFNNGSPAAGKLTVTKVTIPSSKLTSTTDFDITSSTTGLTSVIGNLNAKLENVKLYDDGLTYYEIRIKHFGDDLTPWNTSEYGATKPAEPTTTDVTDKARTDKIYPGTTTEQDNNYLGRYGMVRNNWYLLQIGEILKIGEATVPDLTTHPDDELEDMWIKARINILSWAKRPQSWNLK